MKPAEVSAAQAGLVEQIKAGPKDTAVVLERVANEVARAVRADAARHGHRVGIRVVRKAAGVRLTVTGPQAPRYRVPVEKAMRDRVPGAAVEIRAMMTRRAK